MNLLLLSYNNYFNRKLKMFDTLSEYLAFATENNGQLVQNINFIPNDGIDTEQIINSESIINNEFDYVVCFDNEEINSRWFVKECVRLRSAQYKLTLHRDVIADNYHNIENDPIFVQKGHLNDNDSMICNSEGMTFTQKLNDLTLLYQNNDNYLQNLVSPRPRQTNAWIVGYVNPGNITHNSISYQGIGSPEDYETLATLSQKTGISSELLSEMISYPNQQQNYGHSADSFNIRCNVRLEGTQYQFKTLTIPYGNTDESAKIQVDSYNRYILNNEFYSLSSKMSRKELSDTYWAFDGYNERFEAINPENGNIYDSDVLLGDYLPILAYKLQSLPLDNVLNILNSSTTESQGNNNYISMTQMQNLMSIPNGTIFYDSENQKYYSITIIAKNSNRRNEIPVVNPTIQNWLNNTVPGRIEGTVNTSRKFQLEIKGRDVTIQLQEVENYNVTVPISSSRNHCAGSVCDIFAIPLNGVRFATGSSLLDEVSSISDVNYLIGLASQIGRVMNEECYDIQILPYCPIPLVSRLNITTRRRYWLHDLSTLTEHLDYDLIKEGDTVRTFMYWFKNCNFSTNLDYRFTFENRKVESQTDFLRICSPNGHDSFEINVAKNNGIVGLQANCTYKPYTPFIQVIPNFDNEIYGFNVEKDYRGLICGGDFSLSRLYDKWQEFELNNKNYQNIFARDMLSLERHQNVERTRSLLSAPGQVLGSTMSGATSGARYGGAYGAVAGAAIGAVSGAASAGINYSLAESMRQETKDYAIDKFSYQLGNIQALPEAIAKLSTFNIASKFVPYVEHYTCTDKEREALEAKIKYNGMNVQRIGTIAEFRNELEPHFFQGQYIMNEENNIRADSHMLSTIYDELLKGLYL